MFRIDESGVTNNHFVCDMCQLLRPVSQMDGDIPRRYGVPAARVLEVIQEDDALLCQDCAEVLEDARQDGANGCRGDQMRWYLDFDDTDHLERERLDWLRQNY